MVVGEDQRFFLPGSVICGALLLSATSVISKILIPGAILPIGVITALVGVPFFRAHFRQQETRMVALALKDVGAAYGRTTVLSKVGIDTLESGSVTAVIGPNAAGKSTLFKRIASLISGPGLVELSDTARGNRAICYMPQDTGANAVLTVYESVLLSAKQGGGWRVHDDELFEIDAILKALKIHDLAFRGSANCLAVSGSLCPRRRRWPASRRCC